MPKDDKADKENTELINSTWTGVIPGERSDVENFSPARVFDDITLLTIRSSCHSQTSARRAAARRDQSGPDSARIYPQSGAGSIEHESFGTRTDRNGSATL